jgi:hypothetical protein
MPNVSYHLSANPGAFAAVQPIPPTTINNGAVDVATAS